jgi:hypothetical protein
MPDTPITYLLAIHLDSDARLRAGVAACLKYLGRRAGISTGPLCRLPDGVTVAELLELASKRVEKEADHAQATHQTGVAGGRLG